MSVCSFLPFVVFVWSLLFMVNIYIHFTEDRYIQGLGIVSFISALSKLYISVMRTVIYHTKHLFYA